MTIVRWTAETSPTAPKFRTQSEKLVPQPQERSHSDFSTRNEAPISWRRYGQALVIVAGSAPRQSTRFERSRVRICKVGRYSRLLRSAGQRGRPPTTERLLEPEASASKIRFRSGAYSEVRDIDCEYHSNSPRTMQACDMLQVLPKIATCPTVKSWPMNTA